VESTAIVARKGISRKIEDAKGLNVPYWLVSDSGPDDGQLDSN
jgi:hypothetical protein